MLLNFYSYKFFLFSTIFSKKEIKYPKRQYFLMVPVIDKICRSVKIRIRKMYAILLTEANLYILKFYIANAKVFTSGLFGSDYFTDIARRTRASSIYCRNTVFILFAFMHVFIIELQFLFSSKIWLNVPSKSGVFQSYQLYSYSNRRFC